MGWARSVESLAPVAFFRRQIRWKIIFPFACLSLLVAVAGTYLTTKVVAGSLGERFDNQLAEAARVSADAVVRRERKHLEVLRALTFTEGMAGAVAANDRVQLERLVPPLVANAGAERADVFDPQGRLLYGLRRNRGTGPATYSALTGDEPYGDWEPLHRVLSGVRDSGGDKFAGVVRTGSGYALISAGPLLEDGRLVGAVVVSTDLSTVLAGAKLEALTDLTFYSTDGEPFATTLPEEGLDGLRLLVPGPEARAAIAQAATVREARELYGRDFDFLYGTLLIRDTPFVYSVALPSSFITSAASFTRWQMTALFTIATAAVLVTGWVVAAALTRPVATLARTAEAVAAGDLSARSGVETGDEIGTLARTFDTMTAHLQRQHLSTVRALASAIDARDPYTLGHSLRVGQLSALIGSTMGLSRLEVQHLEIGGYLHDIGKIGVRDSVLLKPGTLTMAERQLIEEHPVIGLRILNPIDLPDPVRQFVAEHHERLDGSGYPSRLKGDELSVFARIGAVADMYDALTTERPYRAALAVDDVLELLFREASGSRLDVKVVEATSRVARDWEEIRRTNAVVGGFVPFEREERRAS